MSKLPEHQPLRITADKPSTISTGQLHVLLRFHLRPIKLVVSQRSYPVTR